MKNNDLLLVGALAVGGYLVYTKVIKPQGQPVDSTAAFGNPAIGDPLGMFQKWLSGIVAGALTPSPQGSPAPPSSPIPSLSIPLLSDIQKLAGVSQSLETSLMAGSMHTQELLMGGKSFFTPAQFFVPASFENPAVLQSRAIAQSAPKAMAGPYTPAGSMTPVYRPSYSAGGVNYSALPKKSSPVISSSKSSVGYGPQNKLYTPMIPYSRLV